MSDVHEAPPPATPSGWRIARLGGVPVILSGGWVAITVLMVVLFGPQLSDELPTLGLRAYAVAAGYALLLLVSVLVHEMSHALVAHLCGYRVSHIVADVMGGHTAYDASGATPAHSALIAAVGPLSNGVLAAIGVALLDVTTPGVPSLLAAAFAWTNGVVAVFNLLPGLPLDGGFLLEALVWGVTGRRHLGLLVAGWAGRVVTVVAVVWGLARPLWLGTRPSLITLVWVLLVASFLWRGASQAIAAGGLRRDLAGLHLDDVARPVRLLPADARVRDLVGPSTATQQERGVTVLVGPEGQLLGHVDPVAVAAARDEADLDAPLQESLLAHPSSWLLPEPAGGGAVETVVATMAQRGLSVVLLVDAQGRPTRLVSAADIDEGLTSG